MRKLFVSFRRVTLNCLLLTPVLATVWTNHAEASTTDDRRRLDLHLASSLAAIERVAVDGKTVGGTLEEVSRDGNGRWFKVILRNPFPGEKIEDAVPGTVFTLFRGNEKMHDLANFWPNARLEPRIEFFVALQESRQLSSSDEQVLVLLVRTRGFVDSIDTISLNGELIP